MTNITTKETFELVKNYIAADGRVTTPSYIITPHLMSEELEDGRISFRVDYNIVGAGTLSFEQIRSIYKICECLETNIDTMVDVRNNW